MTDDARGPVPSESPHVESSHRTSTLAAFRYPQFRLFWFGLVVSNTGTWMQMFGQGYLVVQLALRDGVPHLAPLYLGLVGLARAIPGLTLGLFGGAIADRVDRRKLLLVTQSSAAVVAGVLAALTISGRINLVEVILLSAASSTIFAFDAPTRQSLVPRLVRERDLMSAIGLNSMAFNGPQVAGPVLGGILFIPFGLGGLFLLNAVSYLAVVAALGFMTSVPAGERSAGLSVLQSIREGLRYIRREPVVRWLVVIAAFSALLARPYIQLLPAFASDVLHVGAVELSWLMGASGVGALAGSIATAALGNLRRRGLVVLASAFAMSALVALFSLQRVLVGAVPLLVLLGFASMLFMGMTNTLLQTRTPDHLRGRVMSVQTMMFMGLMPLGTLVLGAAGTLIGIHYALLAGSIAVAALVAYAAARVAPLRGAVATASRTTAPARLRA